MENYVDWATRLLIFITLWTLGIEAGIVAVIAMMIWTPGISTFGPAYWGRGLRAAQ